MAKTFQQLLDPVEAARAVTQYVVLVRRMHGTGDAKRRATKDCAITAVTPRKNS